MQDVLGYESQDAGTLEAGEKLLWEGGSQRLGRPRFRITDRRVFCVDGKENLTRHTVTVRLPFRGVTTIVGANDRAASIRLGTSLWITSAGDWTEPCQYYLQANVRRLRRRRGARRQAPGRTMDYHATDLKPANEYATATTDLGLIEGEAVLWSGQPVTRRPVRWSDVRGKLVTLTLLIIPTMLGIKVYYTQPILASDVLLGALAVIWMIAGIHSMITKPIIRRWKLSRTRYVLTTRRAFVIQPQQHARRISFVFVDALSPSFHRAVESDGTGDVTVGQSITFQQIPDAVSVHQKLVEAVLTARRDLPDLGWQDSPGISQD